MLEEKLYLGYQKQTCGDISMPKKSRPKKSRAIILKDLSPNFIVDPTKDIIIRLPESERNQKEYYLDTIKVQKESIKKLKDVINSLSGKQDELKYLREFRNMFSGQCIAGNVRRTIIQCTEHIRKGRCKFKDSCTLRKKWDKLVKV